MTRKNSITWPDGEAVAVILPAMALGIDSAIGNQHKRRHLLLLSPSSVIDYGSYDVGRVVPRGTRQCDMPTPEDAARIIGKYLTMKYLQKSWYNYLLVEGDKPERFVAAVKCGSGWNASFPSLGDCKWPNLRLGVLDCISYRAWIDEWERVRGLCVTGVKHPEVQYPLDDATIDRCIREAGHEKARSLAYLLPIIEPLRSRIEQLICTSLARWA